MSSNRLYHVNILSFRTHRKVFESRFSRHQNRKVFGSFENFLLGTCFSTSLLCYIRKRVFFRPKTRFLDLFFRVSKSKTRHFTIPHSSHSITCSCFLLRVFWTFCFLGSKNAFRPQHGVITKKHVFFGHFKVNQGVFGSKKRVKKRDFPWFALKRVFFMWYENLYGVACF